MAKKSRAARKREAAKAKTVIKSVKAPEDTGASAGEEKAAIAKAEAEAKAKAEAEAEAKAKAEAEAKAKAEAEAKAKAEAEAKAKAEAEAKAMAIKSEALSKNKALVEYEAVLKWNGELPQYMMGNSVPFINVGK